MGAAQLLPYLNDATNGFLQLSNSKTSMAKALNNTKNCGTSGTTEPLLTVAEGNKNLSQAFYALSSALRNNTDSNHQLKLLSDGNLTAVTIQIENSANALKSLSQEYDNLTENINTVSLDGVDQLVTSLQTLANSSVDFDDAFTNFALLPSRALLQLVSVPGLSNFTNSVHQVSMAYQSELGAIKTAEERCGISTGLQDPISSLANITHTIYEHLQPSAPQ